jgi:regulator of protease activity HflC (stomatin/prohibitin superfamily)
MSKVDLRIVTLTVPPQEVITRDNVTIKVTAVLYFYVVDPIAAIVNVVNFQQATTQIGQTTLRNVLGQSELDELLAERNKINRDLQAIIDEQTERWGVKVTAVEIKDVELPATMQRAMAKQVEAEREKRAKVIHARGELQASTQLAQAAEVIGSQPAALQLRYLQTLIEIAVEKNSTIILPLPMDLLAPLMQIMQQQVNVAVQKPLNGSRRNEPSLLSGRTITDAPLSDLCYRYQSRSTPTCQSRHLPHWRARCRFIAAPQAILFPRLPCH